VKVRNGYKKFKFGPVVSSRELHNEPGASPYNREISGLVVNYKLLKIYTGCSKSLFTEKPDIKTTYLLNIVLQKMEFKATLARHVC
jgi:hypothetical protein